MALTRPRAYQIYDIDYKQAVRVVTISNITLAGGAPNSVDGVNLSLNDRVLVTGQTSGVQNGIYYVTTLGSGSNGTWTRSIDTDATGELLSGTIVMVTEGTTYADTQWKLTTNDPITIGVTSLTFVQNYLANSISYGATSFAIASSNANAIVSVSGTGNVVVWAPTGEYVTGLVSASGNVTAAGNVSGTYILGNVYYATGFSASKIYNGTTEANIGTSGGNANISVGGTSNVAVFATTGEYITGLISATGNIITAANVSGGNVLATTIVSGASILGSLISSSGNITATSNIAGGNVLATTTVSAASHIGSTVSVTANITGGNILTGGIISATGNITGSYIIGNGSQLTGLNIGNSFGVISVTGQSNVYANTANAVVSFAGGTGIAITTDSTNAIVTVSSVSTTSIFSTGGDMGTVTEAVTTSEDLGNVTDAATISYDLGSVVSASGLIYPSMLVLPTYTVGTLPTANPAGQFVYLSTSSIGAMTAFSDGTNWRFTSSGNIVS